MIPASHLRESDPEEYQRRQDAAREAWATRDWNAWGR